MGKFFLIVLCLTSLSQSAFAHDPYTDPADETALAPHCLKWLENFESLIGKSPSFSSLRDSSKIDAPLFYAAKGVPKGARLRTVGAGEIFRQYVKDRSALQAILQSSELRAGNRPYFEGGGQSIFVYNDLTGIFITSPEVSWDFVGVDSSLFVDFTLPPGTKLLNIRDGIMLLPGPPSNASWLMAEYEKWKKDPSTVDKVAVNQMKKMDQEGVLIPRYQKIHIVAHSPIKTEAN